jgi:hypothetical protein
MNSTQRALRAPILWFQVEEILVWLTLGYMPEFARPPTGFSGSKCVSQPEAMPAPIGWVEIDKERLSLLQTRLNTVFKLMNKVLPDLKAMEFTDVTEGTSAIRDPVTLARQVRGMLAIEDASRAAPGSGRMQ